MATSAKRKSCNTDFTLCLSYLDVTWCCEYHNQPQKFMIAMASPVTVKGRHFTLNGQEPEENKKALFTDDPLTLVTTLVTTKAFFFETYKPLVSH